MYALVSDQGGITGVGFWSRWSGAGDNRKMVVPSRLLYEYGPNGSCQIMA